MVIRKAGVDAAGHVKHLREKLALSVSSPQASVASAFGSDGVPQGVPVQGLDNLLADLGSGKLEGILMLQARPPGPRKGVISMEVQYVVGKEGKPYLRARLPSSEPPNTAASSSLKAFREELQAMAKRILLCLESSRKVRVLPGLVLEFVCEKGALVLVGARDLVTSAAPGEAELASQLMFSAAAQRVALANSSHVVGEASGAPGHLQDRSQYNISSQFSADSNSIMSGAASTEDESNGSPRLGSAPATINALPNSSSSVGGMGNAAVTDNRHSPSLGTMAWGEGNSFMRHALAAQPVAHEHLDFNVPGVVKLNTTGVALGTPLPMFDLETPLGGGVGYGVSWGATSLVSHRKLQESPSTSLVRKTIISPRNEAFREGKKNLSDGGKSRSPSPIASPVAASGAAASVSRSRVRGRQRKESIGEWGGGTKTDSEWEKTEADVANKNTPALSNGAKSSTSQGNRPSQVSPYGRKDLIGKKQQLRADDPSSPNQDSEFSPFFRNSNSSPKGNSLTALKKRVRELEMALSVARTGERAGKNSNDSEISGLAASDPPSLAALRASGRFNYVELSVPGPEAGRSALVELIGTLQNRWKDALALVGEVKGILLGEKSSLATLLQNSHQQELKNTRASLNSVEDTLLQTRARLDASQAELSACQRREAQANERISKQASEIRKLSEDLSAILGATPATASKLQVRGATTSSGGGSPKLGPSTAKRVPGVLRSAAADALGGGFSNVNNNSIMVSTSSMVSSTITTTSSEGESEGGGVSPASSTTQLTIKVRQLEDEVEQLRSNLAAEARGRTEAAALWATQSVEHRRERTRLAALVSALEQAERVRMRDVISESSAGETGGVPLVAALMDKTREVESLQLAMAALKVDLTAAREDVQSAATSRMESAARLEALLPLKLSLEAELAALRSECTALRLASGGTVARFASPPGKSSLVKASPDASHGEERESKDDELHPPSIALHSTPPKSAPTTTTTTSVVDAAAHQQQDDIKKLTDAMASERAAATRAVVECTLLRNELKGLNAACEKAMKESVSAKQSLASLKASRASEIEAVRNAAEADSATLLRQHSSAAAQALKESLRSVQEEMGARHKAEIDKLREEAASAQAASAALTGDVNRMRSEISTLTSVIQEQRKRAAAASGDNSASVALPNSNSLGDGGEMLVSLQAKLAAAQSTELSLRKENAHLREAAAESLNELAQSYTSKLATMQQLHGSELVTARQIVAAEAAGALTKALETERAAAASAVDRALREGRESLELERMKGEETMERLRASLEARFEAACATAATKARESQAAAVREAVQVAQWEWEKVTGEALAALHDGGAQTAAVQASAAALAAKREVESNMAVAWTAKEAELESLRSRCGYLEGEVLARERLLKEQAAASAEALSENSAANASLIAAAQTASLDAMARALAGKQAEMDAALASLERREAGKLAAALGEAKIAAARGLEEGVAAAVLATRASTSAQLEALHKVAVEKAVGEALSVVTALSSETQQQFAAYQARFELERDNTERAHRAKLAELQETNARLLEALEAGARDTATTNAAAFKESSEAAYRVRSEAAREVESLRAQLVELRSELTAAVEREMKTVADVRASGEAEIRRVKERATADVASAREVAESRALTSVEEAMGRVRVQWAKEMERAVTSAAAEAREDFLTQLKLLSSSADTQFASQAELFQQMEAGWAQRYAALERAKAALEEAASEELQTLRAAVAAAEKAREEDRSTAAVALREAEEAGARAAARSREEALDAANSAAMAAREAAVRTAVETALATAQGRFENERASALEASRAAMEAMAAEAENLVAAARSRGVKELEEAEASARVAGAAAVASAVADVRQELARMSSLEKEQALSALALRHAQEIAELQGCLAEALSSESRAREAVENAENRAKSMLHEAEEKWLTSLEASLREGEAAWKVRLGELQASNEQAAGIIAGLLKEADGATQGLARAQEEAARDRERHAGELARVAAARALREEEFSARLERAREATEEKGNRAMREVEDRCASLLAAGAAKWASERAELMAQLQQQFELAEAARNAASAAQSVQDEVSRWEKAAAQLRVLHESETEALKASHAREIAALTASLRREAAEELEKAGAEAASRASAELTAAVSRVVAEQDARVGELESAVSEKLSAAARAQSTATSAALAAAAASHSEEIARLRAQHEAAISTLRSEASQAAASSVEALAKMQSGYEAELEALRDATLPTSVVEEIRAKMESQASSAVNSALEAAVEASKRDAEALRSVLTTRLEEAEADRKQLSATIDMLQVAVASQLAEASAAIRAAEIRAHRSTMAAEDAEGLLLREREEGEGAGENSGYLSSAEAREWVSREVSAARAALESELVSRGAELSSITNAQAKSWAGARETMLTRIADLEALVTSTRTGAAEASAERDSLIADLRATCADLTTRLAFAEGELQDRLRSAMRDAVAVERSAQEDRARSALAAAVSEAVEAGIREKEAALAALRAECEARLEEFETVAAHVRAAERAALEAAHREQIEGLIAQACAERDELSRRLEALRAEELLSAQAQTASALEQARLEGMEALEAARKAAGEEREALARAAAEDLGEALTAAKGEMSSLLGTLDQEWQVRSDSLLTNQAEQNQKALTLLLEASRQRLEECARGYEARLLECEDSYMALLRRHQAYIPTVLATQRAELEADKVAALAAMNAEWVGKMETRVAELMETRTRELAALKAEYQAHVDGVVSTLETQRQGALSAFSTEYAAERERLLAEKAVAVAEAIRLERGAAERNLALALARAEEDKQLLLQEQAEKMAAERAEALAALRRQATEEHEEANDALRLESEKLLMSIEGAMSKLRDERDVAADDREILRKQLDSEKLTTTSLRETVGQLKRAGSLATLKAYILAGKYVSVLAAVKAEAESRRVGDLKALNALWEARHSEEVALKEQWIRKFYILCESREEMADALTNFKRDLLVQHKVKCTTLAQGVASLSDQRKELQHDILVLTSQVKESEGGIKSLEKTINEISKDSILGPGGVVNESLQKRKNRLAKDMDSAIVRLEDRKKALREVADRAKDIEDARESKEAELKQVEANLVSTLVAQQRQLKAILDAIPLAAEEMEIPKDERENGTERLDALPPGGSPTNISDTSSSFHAQHSPQRIVSSPTGAIASF